MDYLLKSVDTVSQTIIKMPSLINKLLISSTLNTSKCYNKITVKGKKEKKEYVGQFVKTYDIESGGELKSFIEFNKNGRVVVMANTLDESNNKNKSVHYVETECKTIIGGKTMKKNKKLRNTYKNRK